MLYIGESRSWPKNNVCVFVVYSTPSVFVASYTQQLIGFTTIHILYLALVPSQLCGTQQKHHIIGASHW